MLGSPNLITESLPWWAHSWCFLVLPHAVWASLVVQLVKNPPAVQETPVQFPGSGRSPREGIGYPLQYSWPSLVAQLVKNPSAMQET